MQAKPTAQPPPVSTPPAKAVPEKSVEEINAEFEADILKILDDGKDRIHTEIRERMEQIGWKAEKPGTLGRQIQGVLLTLKNRGAVDYVGERIWKKAKVEATSTA
jgi:hypothetical protein